MNRSMRILWWTGLVLLSLWATSPAMGQRAESHSLMFGVGRSNQLDTYLSPMEYTGPQFSVVRETLRMTKAAQGRLSFQSLTAAATSYTENPAQTGRDIAGRLGYSAAWHYHWLPRPNLRLMAGGMVEGDAGFLYNTRNGNNPAQGRARADLAASLAGIYRCHLRKQPFTFRYQVDMPIVGCMFSPQFGQSYWEISQGNRDHNVCPTYVGNALSLHQLLTVDVPLGRFVLRAGYLSDIRQSHVNQIRVHDISRSFVLGFVRHLHLVGNKKEGREDFIL